MKNVFLLFALSILTLSCQKNNNIEKLNYKIKANSSFEEDKLVIAELWAKITALSESEVCNNPNDWLWVGYGNKACGGYWGYIAYNKNINTEDFLYKVTYHFNLEGEFNDKHGSFSPCDIANEPSEVKCEDGKAKLIY